MNKFFVSLALVVSVLSSAAATAPAQAQCADCGADANKADRERAGREAADRAEHDRADKGREALGSGTAGQAADAAKDHYDKADKAADPQ